MKDWEVLTEESEMQFEGDGAWWSVSTAAIGYKAGQFKDQRIKFRTLAPKPKRKVAKCAIVHYSDRMYYFAIRKFIYTDCLTSKFYTTQKSALRGARRFCKAIGYEMEVVK
jgi:hypothetical protein